MYKCIFVEHDLMNTCQYILNDIWLTGSVQHNHPITLDRTSCKITLKTVGQISVVTRKLGASACILTKVLSGKTFDTHRPEQNGRLSDKRHFDSIDMTIFSFSIQLYACLSIKQAYLNQWWQSAATPICLPIPHWFNWANLTSQLFGGSMFVVINVHGGSKSC